MSSIIEHTDPVNTQILAVSEDKIQGFVREPFAAIAEKSGVPLETVLERIKGMLSAGTIRRVRQTLVASNLAEGALVAWQVPEEKLNDAFDWMFKNDPFSGHVVVRSTDQQTTGSIFRLWTTLKTPVGVDMAKHCEVLDAPHRLHEIQTHAREGHSSLSAWATCGARPSSPGDKSDERAKMIPVGIVNLTEQE